MITESLSTVLAIALIIAVLVVAVSFIVLTVMVVKKNRRRTGIVVRESIVTKENWTEAQLHRYLVLKLQNEILAANCLKVTVTDDGIATGELGVYYADKK